MTRDNIVLTEFARGEWERMGIHLDSHTDADPLTVEETSWQLAAGRQRPRRRPGHARPRHALARLRGGGGCRVVVGMTDPLTNAMTQAIEGQNLYHGRHGTTPAGSATARAILRHLRDLGWDMVFTEISGPLDPTCTCGPWQIGQPQGHLAGCPRAISDELDAEELDAEELHPNAEWNKFDD